MKIFDVVQGTQAWLALRAGMPTSSDFDKIITPGGKPSASASAYCNKLLCEVMLGRPLIGTSMPWMDRGKQMEAEAVKYYEFQRNVETIPVGFITTNDQRVGASPDRLIGDKGLLEIKCPTDETQSKYLAAHIDALLGTELTVAETYKVQCQGQLWIAEREWTDILAYYPGLPEALSRVRRDDPFITKMDVEVRNFLAMFDDRLAKLKALGYLDEAVEIRKTEAAKDSPKPDAVADYVAKLKQRKEAPKGDFDLTDQDVDRILAAQQFA